MKDSFGWIENKKEKWGRENLHPGPKLERQSERKNGLEDFYTLCPLTFFLVIGK